MRELGLLLLVGTVATSGSVSAADYRTGEVAPAPSVIFVGIAPPRPLYLVASPPQYVRDLRTGQVSWVTLQPSFLDRLFGERGGY